MSEVQARSTGRSVLRQDNTPPGYTYTMPTTTKVPLVAEIGAADVAEPGILYPSERR